MKKDALIDKTGKYRYWLLRQWGKNSDNFVNFVLLNPSTADARIDDPTIRRCINFGTKWGLDGIYVTNLFAFRATNPKDLRETLDPVGKENNKYLKFIAKKAKLVVIAWGNHGSFKQRDKEVLNILSKIHPLYCLGVTRLGQPKHPLRLNRNTKKRRFIVARQIA